MNDPFADIYQACNTGDPKDKLAGLADFPRMIDVELTNSCNFRCKMCPTGNLSMKRPTGLMRRETFDNLVRQCEPYGTALRFIGWGESTMHPDLISFIEWATDNGMMTHLNTNGKLLDLVMAIQLTEAGLTSIKFSFQGVDQSSYEKMRNIDFYDGVFDAICNMFIAGEDKKRPFISVSTTTTNEPEDMIEAFREKFERICDKVSIGKTTFDFINLDEVRLSEEDNASIRELASQQFEPMAHPDPCPEVYSKLSLSWDGTVRVCCNDHSGETNLGNINETSISKIWRHPTMEAYRERLSRKVYTGPLCSVCYDYLGVTKG